jgi:hypothetical protein
MSPFSTDVQVFGRILLTVASLSSFALADAVTIGGSKGSPDKASVKVVQIPGGTSRVVVDNSDTSQNITSVKVTVPQGASASCSSCTSGTDSKGNTTLTWNGTIEKNELTPYDFKTNTNVVNVTVTFGGHSESKQVFSQAPKKAPTGKKVDKSDDHKSVAFDASTGRLTIHDDKILPTPFPGDPLNDASVLPPEYSLVGPDTDPNFIAFQSAIEGQLFQVQQGSSLLIRAAAPFLYYDIAQNRFVAELDLPALAGAPVNTALYSGALPSVGSQALTELNNLINPTGAEFLTDPLFAAAFVPDANFNAGSSGFTASFDVGSTDYFIVAPEPGTLLPVLAGLIALALIRITACPKQSHRTTRRDPVPAGR